MRFYFFRRNQALFAQINLVLLKDAQVAEPAFEQEQAQATAAGVNRQHSSKRRFEAARLQHGDAGLIYFVFGAAGSSS